MSRNSNRVRALFDFAPTGPEELSIGKGDSLRLVQSDTDGWSLVRNLYGDEGLVPTSYIKPLSAPLPGPVLHSDAELVRQEAELRQLEDEEVAPRRYVDSEDEEGESRSKPKQGKAGSLLRKITRRKPQESDGTLRSGTKSTRDDRHAYFDDDEPLPMRSPRLQPIEKFAPAKGKPHKSNVRIWYDKTGEFKTEAAFLGCAVDRRGNAIIRLHKSNGHTVAVVAAMMSLADVQ